MPLKEDLKKMNKIQIPDGQEAIQTPVVLQYMLMNPEVVSTLVEKHKAAIDMLKIMQITVEREQNELEKSIQSLEGKLIQSVEKTVCNMVEKYIKMEEEIQKEKFAFKRKAIAIAIIVGIAMGLIVRLFH